MTDNNKNTDEMLQRLLQATSADWSNKSKYANRIQQTEQVTVFAEDGTPIEKEVTFYISMESINAVLSLVRKKALIPDDYRLQTK